MKDIFSIDNLLHSIVSVAFVALIGLVAMVLGIGAVVVFVAAALAGVGLYLREASQVDWDFKLEGSFHKHMEWVVGTVAGFIAAIVFIIVS